MQNQIDDINNRIITKQDLLISLEAEYVGKQKGNLYSSRKQGLINAIKSLHLKMDKLGKTHNIVEVTGKAYRPTNKEQTMKLADSFSLLYVNISTADAITLVKEKFKTDYISANAREIPLGEPVFTESGN